MKFEIKFLNEWLIAIVLLVVISVTAVFYVGNATSNQLLQFFNPNHGMVLIGLETVDSIKIFGGEVPPAREINVTTISVLISVVFLLMAGPWLFYMGYKHFEDDNSKYKPWYWFIGAVIVLFAISAIPVTINSVRVFENTKESAQVSRTKDLMRQELMEVGLAAAELGALENGFNESFRVEDLEMADLKYEYSVENISSDSLVTIVSTGLKAEGDFSFKVTVNPYQRKVLSFRN
jgi:uncharacterized membrane protein YccF (DUF307 family)